MTARKRLRPIERDILARLARGEYYELIAKHYGCTRERIRLIEAQARKVQARQEAT